MVMSGIPIPKPVRIEDEEYSELVRHLPCKICGRPPRPKNHRHHLTGGGMGTKNDDYKSFSMCGGCHHEIHHIGILTWEERYDTTQLKCIEETQEILSWYIEEKGIEL